VWWRHQVLKERLIVYTRDQLKQARQNGEKMQSMWADLISEPLPLALPGFSPMRGDLLYTMPRAVQILAIQRYPVQILLPEGASGR